MADSGDVTSLGEVMPPSPKPMRFTLTGFTQEGGFRVFAYQGIGEDRVRVKFTVRVDLALSRQFGIRMQELPLLCLGLLERECLTSGNESRDLTFAEEAMTRQVEDVAAAEEAAEALRPRRQAKPKVDEEADPPVDSSNGIHPLPYNPYLPRW